MNDHGICEQCGNNGRLNPDGVCITCLIGPAGAVPQVDARLMSKEEIDSLLDEVRYRLTRGQEKYRGSYLEADLRADLEQELLDGALYMLLMVKRIREVLPRFAGPDSKTLARAQ